MIQYHEPYKTIKEPNIKINSNININKDKQNIQNYSYR